MDLRTHRIVTVLALALSLGMGTAATSNAADEGTPKPAKPSLEDVPSLAQAAEKELPEGRVPPGHVYNPPASAENRLMQPTCATKGRVQTCLTPDPGNSTADTDAAASPRSVNLICVNIALNGTGSPRELATDRANSCRMELWQYYVTVDGVQVAYFPFALYLQYGPMPNNSTTFPAELNIQYNPSGGFPPVGQLLPNLYFGVSPLTRPGCTSTGGSGAVSVPASTGSSGTVSVPFTVSCPPPSLSPTDRWVSPENVASVNYRMWTLNYAVPDLPGIMNTSNLLAIRCDRFRLNIGAACALSNVDGIVHMDTNDANYGLAAEGYRYWSVNLQGFLGYIGPYGYGDPLEYTLDSTIQNANTQAACGVFTPLYSGDQCDEYPPKATRNGAAGGQYGIDWGRCSMPAGQNGQAGNRFQGEWQSQRIVEFDYFRVQVDGPDHGLGARCYQ